LRIQPSTQRQLQPDLSRLARQVQREQREQETFDGLLDRCQLYPLGNDIFCDEIFHQTTQPRKTHNRHGEEPQTPIAISSGTQFTRDPYLAVVETSPDLRYNYSPMLEALVQLGSCVSTVRGFSGVSMILNRKGRLLALEYWRCKGCIVVWRMFSSNF
jgi:hypothetical protein